STLTSARDLLHSLTMSPSRAAQSGWSVNQDGRVRSAFEYLAYQDIDFGDLTKVWPELDTVSPSIQEQMAIDAQYARYLDRQAADIHALRKDEALQLPGDLDYGRIGGLSNEVRSRLQTARPETLGQAGRIEGVTPSALTALLAHVKRKSG
ncbi:MAG: tRNA uridine-5-carboxymethylaminomethyl(34) synthesis enzyme MnmG, partial [Pseudomonadota bacterium]